MCVGLIGGGKKNGRLVGSGAGWMARLVAKQIRSVYSYPVTLAS